MQRNFSTCFLALILLAGSANAVWAESQGYQQYEYSGEQASEQPTTSQWQPQYCAPDCNTYCGPYDISYDSCPSSSWFGCWDGVWGAYGQFLWLGLYGEQLDYGAYVFIEDDASPFRSITSETLTHKFNWKPGVRLGLFYQSPCGGADVAFEWFYYRNNHGVVNPFVAPEGNFSYQVSSSYLYAPTPSFTVDADNLIELALSSQMSFRINHFLLKYGTFLNWNCDLSFHPYVGPVYYETNQDLTVSMGNISVSGIVEAQSTRINTQLRGVGAKIGSDVSYRFWGDFSLIGDFGVTGVAGDYTLNRTFTSVVLADGSLRADTINDGIRKWTARAILDLSIGFRYSTTFCGGYLGFAQIEWEYHHLFEQTAFLVKNMDFTDELFGGAGVKGFTRSNADLMIHGLSVAIGVAF
jgi:hypothetical protein